MTRAVIYVETLHEPKGSANEVVAHMIMIAHPPWNVEHGHTGLTRLPVKMHLEGSLICTACGHRMAHRK